MKIDRISYQKVFPLSPYVNEKIGIEIQLDDGELVEDALSKGKTIIQEWHIKNNPHVGESVTYSENGSNASLERVSEVNQSPKEKQVGNIASQIATVKDLVVLDSYRLIVKANPQLQPIYDNKLKELSQ